MSYRVCNQCGSILAGDTMRAVVAHKRYCLYASEDLQQRLEANARRIDAGQPWRHR